MATADVTAAPVRFRGAAWLLWREHQKSFTTIISRPDAGNSGVVAQTHTTGGKTHKKRPLSRPEAPYRAFKGLGGKL